jgi:ornithine carbamoyltransferase
MANAFVEAAALYGFELVLACPEGYRPDAGVLNWAREQGARLTLTADRPRPPGTRTT